MTTMSMAMACGVRRVRVRVHVRACTASAAAQWMRWRAMCAGRPSHALRRSSGAHGDGKMTRRRRWRTRCTPLRW